MKMAELTQAQLNNAETMPLEELRQLALREAGEATEEKAQIVESDPTPKGPVTQVRDEKGRFTSNVDVLDNSNDPQDGSEDEEANTSDPEVTIYRKEIHNDDGSVDVYEAESLEDLIDKIAEGKRQAVQQMKKIIAEKKAIESKTQQVSKDEEYLVQQKLKDNPKKTIKDVVSEVIEERIAATQRSEDAQSRFVATHPDYIANSDNGSRMASEVQRLGYTEFSTEGLEKAYQSLKKSGLLILKTEEAGDATETNSATTGRTVQPAQNVTQQRSLKKSSTITSRTRTAATNVNMQPTEDEAYSMPLEKLRELANAQLARANRND
jgi:hypothetical protein